MGRWKSFVNVQKLNLLRFLLWALQNKYPMGSKKDSGFPVYAFFYADKNQIFHQKNKMCTIILQNKLSSTYLRNIHITKRWNLCHNAYFSQPLQSSTSPCTQYIILLGIFSQYILILGALYIFHCSSWVFLHFVAVYFILVNSDNTFHSQITMLLKLIMTLKSVGHSPESVESLNLTYKWSHANSPASHKLGP